MKKIILSEDGRRIQEPSGKKVTASILEVGKTYLHQNHHFLRTIHDIILDLVLYRQVGVEYPFEWYFQRCSAAHFAKICPNEATDEEIEYIKDWDSRF